MAKAAAVGSGQGFCGRRRLWNGIIAFHGQWVSGYRISQRWSQTILIREGSPKLKTVMEGLLQGRTFRTLLDEQVVFSELNQGEEAVWSLLLASGYLKAVQAEFNTECLEMEYELKLTNLEVRIMFLHMIRGWFGGCRMEHNAFLQALLSEPKETLEDAVRSALQQIEEKQYETALLSRGIAPERIRKYGFAFEGSSVLIGKG